MFVVLLDKHGTKEWVKGPRKKKKKRQTPKPTVVASLQIELWHLNFEIQSKYIKGRWHISASLTEAEHLLSYWFLSIFGKSQIFIIQFEWMQYVTDLHARQKKLALFRVWYSALPIAFF